MANYIKPQIPLRRDDNYIYPLTSVDQIVTEKGRLINEIITVDLSEPEFNLEESKVNVDLLGGRPANDFLSVDVKDAETGELYPIYAGESIYTYTHTAGTLSGQGVNGKFKATVDETISSIKVNGTECDVNCNNENEIELISGCWYIFILDGNTINFSKGGVSQKAIQEAAAVVIENNKNEIITALQNSGLGLTEDSTIEEICNALAAKFPGTIVLLNGSTGAGNWTLSKTSGTGTVASTSSGIRFTATSNSGSNSKLGGSMTSVSSYDLTNVSKITITSYYQQGKDGSLALYIKNSSGTTVKNVTLFSYSVNGSSADDPSTVVNSEIDVSSLTGKHSIQIDSYRSAYYSPNTYNEVRNITLVMG